MSAVRENQKSKRMINQKVVKQMDKAFEALIKHLSQDKIEELLKKYALEDENLREEILSKFRPSKMHPLIIWLLANGNEESMTPLKRILSTT